MARERSLFVVLLVVAAVVAGACLLLSQWSELTAPKLQKAWVAVETGHSGVARRHMVAVDAGTPVTLYAVLEARERDGRAVYYTKAPALEVDGKRVPTGAVRPWRGGPREVQLLWFSVEPAVPYRPVTTVEDLASFRFAEFFHPDWPQTWSIPAGFDSRNDDHLQRSHYDQERNFGTQRFQVRISLTDPDEPSDVERFVSWGAKEVPQHKEDFPGVVSQLPVPLTLPSAVFGLSQLEPPLASPPEPLMLKLDDLMREHFAFSRATLLRGYLAARHKRFEDLEWHDVALAQSGLHWGREVHAGDLFQVGDRVAILYKDAGQAGVLDGGDLCLDYDRGAIVAPLGAVFTAGSVDWAPLPP